MVRSSIGMCTREFSGAYACVTTIGRALSLGFRSPEGAWRTIEGYEAMHMIRKRQVRWLDKGDVIGQRQFIHNLFGTAA